MVRDTNGQWSSLKGNYRQTNLIFADGHKIRVPVCSKCLAEIDFDKIFDNLTHNDSAAQRSVTAWKNIKKNMDGTTRVKPTSHKEVKVNFKKGE